MPDSYGSDIAEEFHSYSAHTLLSEKILEYHGH